MPLQRQTLDEACGDGAAPQAMFRKWPHGPNHDFSTQKSEDFYGTPESFQGGQGTVKELSRTSKNFQEIRGASRSFTELKKIWSFQKLQTTSRNSHDFQELAKGSTSKAETTQTETKQNHRSLAQANRQITEIPKNVKSGRRCGRHLAHSVFLIFHV